MLKEDFKIKRISNDELTLVKNLAPVEWNLDLEDLYSKYIGKDYFYPIAATVGSEIAGTGIAVLNENAAWLGTIIVTEKYRGKGLGNAITNHLIDYCVGKGTYSIILTASDMGFPIYKKIGFVTDINYLFLKSENPVKIDSVSKNISKISKNDFNRIFEIDYAVSGEKREKLLNINMKNGVKYATNEIVGYYLPDFGNGLIIATNENAGIELLKFRLSQDQSSIGLPETNKKGIEFLNSIGFIQYSQSPRMFLNKNVNWISENIYARGSGYLG